MINIIILGMFLKVIVTNNN